ncbi:helicase associated domain-containing protein [Pseudofrankia asymbiotica]|uniref:helicase associated domain-containing protein n=1 Tax=Pseudofrankia asymbiotica TaxID=1834516 RepID=UPI001F52516F|nr:helicase associated domain-containing protein [Pseudofrankia asymbiotica]
MGHLSAADAEAEAAEFERGVRAIRAYAAGHGDTDLPHGYVDESGFPLAVWVAVQREAHLEQRLGDARRSALDRVPGWRWAPED